MTVCVCVTRAHRNTHSHNINPEQRRNTHAHVVCTCVCVCGYTPVSVRACGLYEGGKGCMCCEGHVMERDRCMRMEVAYEYAACVGRKCKHVYRYRVHMCVRACVHACVCMCICVCVCVYVCTQKIGCLMLNFVGSIAKVRHIPLLVHRLLGGCDVPTATLQSTQGVKVTK